MPNKLRWNNTCTCPCFNDCIFFLFFWASTFLSNFSSMYGPFSERDIVYFFRRETINLFDAFVLFRVLTPFARLPHGVFGCIPSPLLPSTAVWMRIWMLSNSANMRPPTKMAIPPCFSNYFVLPIFVIKFSNSRITIQVYFSNFA